MTQPKNVREAITLGFSNVHRARQGGCAFGERCFFFTFGDSALSYPTAVRSRVAAIWVGRAAHRSLRMARLCLLRKEHLKVTLYIPGSESEVAQTVGVRYLVKLRSLHTCHGKKRFTVDSLHEVGIHL